MANDPFFLGGLIDPATGDRSGTHLTYEPSDLTTHAVIVGMTGSGKTGLGVALIEEAMLAGVPCLVLDPKGDMGNLALNFPDLQPADFRPWIDESAAVRDGVDPDTVAAETARRWADGLASWDLGQEDMRRLAEAADVTVYTPGSTAGVPMNVVGSLQAPPTGWAGHAETLRDEIEGFTSSLLTLAGVDADPVAAPEHILLANIIEHAWAAGRDLDLTGLIEAVMEPPIRKLGVFDVDAFFPKAERTKLAMRLNGLIASPSFRAWLAGDPLDLETMLFRDGRPRTAVVYLAHLSDQERQFVVTLLLSKLVTWMRGQQGTGALRTLVYMDEVFGFAPPSAEPPSKKPILTILKQARAFGVGMVLSTQNPVDLDYKAMSNAGTWLIGRLQTERDKARILEGISSASGDVDVAAIDDLVSGLGKRAFVLHTTRTREPRVFTTRWVMSYLAGPLTRDQVAALTPEHPPQAPAAPADTSVSRTTVSTGPVVDAVDVVWATPSAPWLAEVGGAPGSTTLAPSAVATVVLRYDDRYAGVDHSETYEAVLHPLDEAGDHLTAVDHDERDFMSTPPRGYDYRTGDVAIESPAYWRQLESALAERLTRERSVTVHKNEALGMYSRVGETAGAFLTRCRAEAEGRADAEIAALTRRYEKRIGTARDAIRTADHRVRELAAEVATRTQTEVVSGAGDLLGALLGGRRGSSGLRRAATRRSQTRRAEDRLETATDTLRMEQEDLVALEDDLARDIAAITERWTAAADTATEIRVPLERSDVRVESLRLCWIPVDPASPSA